MLLINNENIDKLHIGNVILADCNGFKFKTIVKDIKIINKTNSEIITVDDVILSTNINEIQLICLK